MSFIYLSFIIMSFIYPIVAVVQSLSHVWLFATQWTTACQASLYFTTSWNLLKTHVFWVSDAIQPSHPLVPPSPLALNLSSHQGLFQLTWLFASGGQRTGASASVSVLPMNTQGWFPLELNSLFLLSKGLSRVFSSTTIQKRKLSGIQPSLWSNSMSVYDYWKNHSFDYTDLCQSSDFSAF